MGVRILEGTYDGTEDKAAMVDSVTGFAFGPLFDSYEDVNGFLDWLRREPYLAKAEEIGLTERMIPRPDRDATDPRSWPDGGLEKLVSFWKREQEGAAGGG